MQKQKRFHPLPWIIAGISISLLLVAAIHIAPALPFWGNGDYVLRSVAKKPDIDINDWSYLLVNQEHALPENFSIETANSIDGHPFDARAVTFLDAMIADGRQAGMQLMIASAYRSYDHQKTLYENKAAQYQAEGYLEAYSYVKAATVVAKPGESEHNLGLAADIMSADYTELTKGFEDTPEGKWLKKNCSKYGFILRYPKNKEDITGVIYEPWHFRYVGKEAATYMMQCDLTLEEFVSLYLS